MKTKSTIYVTIAIMLLSCNVCLGQKKSAKQAVSEEEKPVMSSIWVNIDDKEDAYMLKFDLASDYRIIKIWFFAHGEYDGKGNFTCYDNYYAIHKPTEWEKNPLYFKIPPLPFSFTFVCIDLTKNIFNGLNAEIKENNGEVTLTVPNFFPSHKPLILKPSNTIGWQQAINVKVNPTKTEKPQLFGYLNKDNPQNVYLLEIYKWYDGTIDAAYFLERGLHTKGKGKDLDTLRFDPAYCEFRGDATNDMIPQPDGSTMMIVHSVDENFEMVGFDSKTDTLQLWWADMELDEEGYPGNQNWINCIIGKDKTGFWHTVTIPKYLPFGKSLVLSAFDKGYTVIVGNEEEEQQQSKPLADELSGTTWKNAPDKVMPFELCFKENNTFLNKISTGFFMGDVECSGTYTYNASSKTGTLKYDEDNEIYKGKVDTFKISGNTLSILHIGYEDLVLYKK